MATINRLGSSNTYDNALRNLQARQNSLSNLQENLTSGKKVVRASDDPTGAAQAERARNRLQRVATDQRALEMQRNSIASAESTLGNVIDTVQSFRELVVSAGSGAKTALDRQTIATQLVGLRDQVVALSNMTDTNGQPLFAGLGSALAPFIGPLTTDPTYSFDGLAGKPPAANSPFRTRSTATLLSCSTKPATAPTTPTFKPTPAPLRWGGSSRPVP
jgi:flagellar hook-associated protein 3 FlgL